MPVVQRTIIVDQSPQAVFAFLADFTTTEEWDPPTLSTRRTSGDGGVGTTYHNVAKFRGKRTEVDYVVTSYVEGHSLQLRGDSGDVELVDTLTVEPTPTGGCAVTYHEEIRAHGALPDSFDAPSLTTLGDYVAESLQESLEHL